MSFSAKVKQELSQHFGNGRHCNIAELSSIVNIYGQVSRFQNIFCLKIQTESFGTAKKFFTLIQNTFNINVDISVRSSGRKRGGRTYTLFVRSPQQTERILRATGIWLDDNHNDVIQRKIYPQL